MGLDSRFGGNDETGSDLGRGPVWVMMHEQLVTLGTPDVRGDLMPMKALFVAIAFAAAVMLAATPALAEDVVYQKHTVVDFGDDTIDGNLNKPDGQYLESRKQLRHARLIKVRENFRTEILQSLRWL